MCIRDRGRIDAGGFSCNLILADRNDCASMAGADQQEHDCDSQYSDAIRVWQGGQSINTGQAESAAGKFHIKDDDSDNLPKTQRDDRQIVTFEPQSWNAYDD